MYEFTLLRHGESQGNIESRHQGQSDWPLTDLGSHQALALAERWQRERRGFDQVLSSPLQRARQTAEIANKFIGASMELDQDFAERDLGQLTGLTHEEASHSVPPPPFLTPYEPYGNTGEGQWQLFLRAGRGLQKMLALPRGRYLIVSHRGFLGMLMYAILGIAPQANFQGPRFHFQNTGFARLTYDTQKHQWRLFAFNDLSHLEDLVVGPTILSESGLVTDSS